MKAYAPGKIVISGAYAVLRNAPALVAAVDRYVVADTAQQAGFRAPEVLAGLPLIGHPADALPYFNADRLREAGRKLGLGSSAGICVASLAALIAQERLGKTGETSAEVLAQELFPIALRAHREAQGGGSGIDVAAACFGGVLAARLSDDSPGERLQVSPCGLPDNLVLETWASPVAASTADFVRKVFATETSAPESFLEHMSAQSDGARAALAAAQSGSSHAFIQALRQQFKALTALGKLANLGIVLPAVDELHQALTDDACFLPSGAGGGDISLYVGQQPSPPDFRARASELGHQLVPLKVGATGLRLEAS